MIPTFVTKWWCLMIVFVSLSKHRNTLSSFLEVKFQDRKEPSPFVKNIAVIISPLKLKISRQKTIPSHWYCLPPSILKSCQNIFCFIYNTFVEALCVLALAFLQTDVRDLSQFLYLLLLTV